ncbi:hypothetical protein HPB51_014038 [Rhipicephalus microplus]|uniref:Uncharacterized protein n=1 Tax=Rhipicephalus microplus TaxID=6941 RepID=A0A9J6EA49_RHIMP|nr:hypothetical protein HPB51_014038 [Rhipicephalus microplus]
MRRNASRCSRSWTASRKCEFACGDHGPYVARKLRSRGYGVTAYNHKMAVVETTVKASRAASCCFPSHFQAFGPRNAGMEPPQKRFRFTVEADIYMLLEVRKEDTYRDPTRWLTIMENLSMAFARAISVRAIRQRCDLLFAQFIREDRANLKK